MSIDTIEQPSVQDATSSAANDDATSQLVSFRLANEEYAVYITHVQEIILIGPLTEMPQVPDYVRGLVNLRGHVIPIIDLRVRFTLPVHEPTEHSRIIVLNVHDKTIGIVVDAVDEVLRIHAEQVEPAPAGLVGLGQQYVSGLVKFEQKLLILLNIERILADDEALGGGES